jgi:hypothetical protein
MQVSIFHACLTAVIEFAWREQALAESGKYVLTARTVTVPRIIFLLFDHHHLRSLFFLLHLQPWGGLDIMSSIGQAEADTFAYLGQMFVIKAVRVVLESICYGTSLASVLDDFSLWCLTLLFIGPLLILTYAWIALFLYVNVFIDFQAIPPRRLFGLLNPQATPSKNERLLLPDIHHCYHVQHLHPVPCEKFCRSHHTPTTDPQCQHDTYNRGQSSYGGP